MSNLTIPVTTPAMIVKANLILVLRSKLQNARKNRTSIFQDLRFFLVFNKFVFLHHQSNCFRSLREDMFFKL